MLLNCVVLALFFSSQSVQLAAGHSPPEVAAVAAAVLVYGNPVVLHNPNVSMLLVGGIETAVGINVGRQAGRFEVVTAQPSDLSLYPGRHDSAAYIIPMQGLQGQRNTTYMEAEAITGDASPETGRNSSSSLASLRAFVQAGGNLILLGNSGTDQALNLIGLVLGRPHGCRQAAMTVRYRLRPGTALLPAVAGAGSVPDLVFPVPLGGGQPGGVELLLCEVAASDAAPTPNRGHSCADHQQGPTPWFDGPTTTYTTWHGAGSSGGNTNDAADNATSVVIDTSGSAVSTTAVGPGFAWAAGRGRIIWWSATVNDTTAIEWFHVLAAAAMAPPLPPSQADRCPPQPAPPLPPRPFPFLWPSRSPPVPLKQPVPKPPMPKPPMPMPKLRPTPPLPRPHPALSQPPVPRQGSTPSPRSTPAPLVAPLLPRPPLLIRTPTPAPSPMPRSLPAMPAPYPFASRGYPPSPGMTVTSSRQPPPSPQPTQPPPLGATDEQSRPPGFSTEYDEGLPPEEPTTPPFPPDAPRPPEGPIQPPSPPLPPPPLSERVCEDFSNATLYNCTAWMEFPDVDFCEDGYTVPSPTTKADLSVLEEVCPRSCGFCCADKYFECAQWANVGYCSWMYIATDPDTQEEQTVLEACQDSCRVCERPGASTTNSSSNSKGSDDRSGEVGRTRRRRLGSQKNRDKRRAAGSEPGKVFAALDPEWKDEDLGTAGNKQKRELDGMLGQLKAKMPRGLDSGTSPGTVIGDTSDKGGPHLDVQKVYAVSGGQGVRFAALDFQTASTKKSSVSFARAYIPLGYNVKPEVVESALRQSVATQRGVAILPPATKVYGNGPQKATQCKSFSEVDAKDSNVGWTLVEAKVSSNLPNNLGAKATECHAVFNEAGNIELSHSEANIGCAKVKQDANGQVDVEPLSNKWQPGARPGGGCSGGGRRRGLLQGCSSSSGGTGVGGGGSGADPGGEGGVGRNCQIRLVRNKDGRLVRRRICRSVNGL